MPGVVISVVIVGQKVHIVLIDQGSSTDVMFSGTFTSFQISPDQLKPYDGVLVGFVEDQVEVQGYVELRTIFSDENAARIIIVKLIILNASSAIASTAHMKMKFPSSEGGVIVIKADQKMTRKYYESSLKNHRGAYAVSIRRARMDNRGAN